MQQTRVSVGLVSTVAEKCEMRSSLTIIELSYRYRDIFDLSYRLSIENSIWHIVTALAKTIFATFLQGKTFFDYSAKSCQSWICH